MSESYFQVEMLEKEILSLEKILIGKKAKLAELKTLNTYSNGLSSNEIVRYSRQMIMPQITINNQIRLKESKVLIVGAGGLGCPAALYLAAAGVGEIHLVDYDEVELTNLHRQILHFESDVGKLKVKSAENKLRNINSVIKVVPHHIHLTSETITKLMEHKFDVLLDCTDNVPTRYLLNDISVNYNIPLVSGSALQMEGQLTVYHYKDGPCYRCLFPTPPPPHTVTNCGDGGVLGPVAGSIGVLQALETIKILSGLDGVLGGRMLIFDGSQTVFRNVKLRGRAINCKVCTDGEPIVDSLDYEQFCGVNAHDKVVDIDILSNDQNVSAQDFSKILNSGEAVVIDVRPEIEYQMCKLPNTINFPFSNIIKTKGFEEFGNQIESHKNSLYVLCRRGNDSQRAVQILKNYYKHKHFVNVKGGLHAYSKLVDSSFPVY